MNEMLPKGWILTKLANVSTHPQYGWTCSSKSSGTLKLLRTTDISDGKINWETVPYCSIEPENDEKYLLKNNDILVSRAGSVGISYRISNSDLLHRTVFASYLIRFCPLIPPTFVEHYFNSHHYWQYISDSQLGIAVPNVNATKLSELPFPLPPLNEQKRIVAKLDQIIPRIYLLKERLDKIPAIIKRFRQSVLMAAVTGKLTERWRTNHPDFDSPLWIKSKNNKIISHEVYRSEWNEIDISENWNCLHLKEIADLRLGKMLDGVKNTGVETKYIRNVNVRWFQFELDDLKTIRLRQEEVIKLSIKNGDVFICEGGEPGRAAVWQSGENKMTFQKALHRVRFHGNVEPLWLVYNLKLDADTDRLSRLFTGSTIKHFTGRSLAEYLLLLPPLEEQKEIVRQVDKLFALADKLESHYQKAKARVDKLSQSILAKAFRGELVITEAELAEKEGRDFESAEKLLDRIPEEKAKLSGNKKSTVPRRSVKGRKNTERKYMDR